MTADIIKSTDLLIIPLKRNITEGIIDKLKARKTLFFLKHTAHITQYAVTSTASTIRYKAKASSEAHPNHVFGMFITIKAKHPYRPICSSTSTALFSHLFSNPSLHFKAKMTFGIIIITIKTSPNMFI